MKTSARSSVRLSRGVSIVLAVIAWGVSGFYSWPALGLGTPGLVILAVGLVRGRRGLVTVGTFGLFLGAVVAGIQHSPVASVLLSVTCTVLAWDIGSMAISIGTQLGRKAETTRLETIHIVASVSIGVVTAGIGYGLYQSGTGGQPITAVGFLLLAAVLLNETLR